MIRWVSIVEVVQQADRRTELEVKIKTLEEERTRLQSEIAKMKEMLATAVLEKKAKELEGEVAQLRTVKTKLEEQMSNKPANDSNKPTVNTGQPASTQKQQSSQNPPIRYGTWSKLPLT